MDGQGLPLLAFVPLPSHPDKLYLEHQRGREQTAQKSEPIKRHFREEQAAGGQVMELGLSLQSPQALICMIGALVCTREHFVTRAANA